MADFPLKVLLIEDNETDAEYLHSLLTRIQNPRFHLEHVSTLSQGLIRLDKGGIDLVVLDLMLPDSRGFDTFQHVHLKFPSVTVVVLSGISDESLAHRILQHGAQDFLVKDQMDFTQVVRSMRFAIERKRGEHALRSSEIQVRTVLENVLDTIITMNAEGTILSFNPAGEKTFGFQAKEVVGQKIGLLMPESFSNKPHGFRRSTISDEISGFLGKHVETKGRHKNGKSIPLEISVNRVNQGGETLYVGITRDISDRKQTEQQLAQAQNELVQATKLAVLGEMSAEIGHELNQPLEAIQAYIDNIEFLMDKKRYDDVMENFHAIGDLTRRAGKIIKNIRKLSQSDSLHSVPVCLEDTIHSALALLSVGNRLDQVKIVQKYPPHKISVLVVALKLEQVLINIITNALDAIETCQEQRIELILSQEKDMALIKIRDSGKGLAASVMPHVMEPFFTTKAPNKGLGLGLSISYNTIKEFNGELLVANHAGGGAEFTIKLPIWE